MLFKYLQVEGGRELSLASEWRQGGVGQVLRGLQWRGGAAPRAGQLCLLACGQKLRQEGAALNSFSTLAFT